MGQAISRVVSLTAREVKTYNLERRAEKIISQDKPTPAPRHPSTIKELERLKEENVSTEYLHKKDERLDKYLKEVYVTSPEPAPPLERKINPDRPLPVKRTTELGISYGYSESEEAAVPEGRVSLKQALAFISNHQNDPKKYSSAAISSEYKLSPADASDILDHFKMFAVKVQKKEVDPASLSTYQQLHLKVKQMTLYNATQIIKEVEDIYSKDKEKIQNSVEKDKEGKSEVVKRPEETDSPPAVNLDRVKQKSESETTMELKETLKKKDLETKPEDYTRNKKAKKQSQENG